MRELSMQEMSAIEPGHGWTMCGVGLGVMLGATVMYGGVGFLFTVNKAWVACVVPALF